MKISGILSSFLLYLLVQKCLPKPLENIKATTKEKNKSAPFSREARCGTKSRQHHTRHKRYILHNSLWTKYILTWRIEKYTDDLPKRRIRKILRRAFRKWSSWTPLQFIERKHGHVDIKISFEYGYHAPCVVPFDGKEGEVAHAYYPYQEQEIAGDIHFDDAEDFTESGYNGKSLPWTALHEIGHSLGLEHSNIWGAVMSPFYASFSHVHQRLSLTRDDINGVQSLYGNPMDGWRTWYFQRRLNRTP